MEGGETRRAAPPAIALLAPAAVVTAPSVFGGVLHFLFSAGLPGFPSLSRRLAFLARLILLGATAIRGVPQCQQKFEVTLAMVRAPQFAQKGALCWAGCGSEDSQVAESLLGE